MRKQELAEQKCPFDVKHIDGKDDDVITVIGFCQNDPLGVGGGMLPDMPVAHFKNGGWMLIADLLTYYELCNSRDMHSHKEG